MDEELGGYRLERVLGRGQSGTVHLARAVSGLDRLVAIKRLQPRGSATDQERLRREAVTMSRLDHPHIVRVHDVISDGDAIALVMQYAPNGSLADHLRADGPLSAEETVELLAPIADALASAHRQGVLHRDVKPSNILFTSDRLALLGDFGIAVDRGEHSITHTDTALGTAGYLDPDLADGSTASPESDQYALGVVCYEALTGLAPYRAPTPLGVLRAADRGIFDPLPRDRTGRLADVVEQAMARRAADRFASVEAFAVALRDAAADIPAAGRKSSDTVRVQPRPDHPTSAERGTPPKVSVPGAPTISPTHTAVTRSTSPTPVTAGPTAPVLKGTASFKRPFGGRPDLGIDTHADTARRRRRTSILATGAAALCVLAIGAVVWSRKGNEPSEGGQVFKQIPCDRASALCVTDVVRTDAGLRVTFSNQEAPIDYRVGARDDALRVSNFFCGATATLALYRPSTGVVYYFREWPSDKVVTGPVEVLADRTGITNANLQIGDRDRDQCADLALTNGKQRTWFLPHRQPGRLENVTVDDTEGATR